ncbi:MAG: hypothetical protein RML40_03645 [Bacteroidota bacterium]|nr:hypothetical protein [Candidatus Kapabacteria bacterium]MDW8219605.1 hypothetical protein [Bacteroidota bacterium]
MVSVDAYGQYWRVGIYQGVAVPTTVLTANSPAWNWTPGASVHYFPRNNALIIGGAVSLQYFGPTYAARQQGMNFEYLGLPISLCFMRLLLPDPPFRPYYGADIGVTWFRYRFFEREIFREMYSNVGVLAAPNGGIKIEIFEGIDLDLNIRYQLLLHERFEWESKVFSGYNMIGISLGLNYAIFRQ